MTNISGQDQGAIEPGRKKEKNVCTELFIYKGMPHGITKPLENLSVLNQNFTWFMHWLKDKELKFDEN